MTRKLRQLTEATIYWDVSDPCNEGWSEKRVYDDGHEESGPNDWANDWADDDDCVRGELTRAMIQLLYENDIDATADGVVYFREDGGYVCWRSEW